MTTPSETTGAAEGEIFKTDTAGRVRVPRARKEALLDEFEPSGASGAQFAADRQASVSSSARRIMATWARAL